MLIKYFILKLFKGIIYWLFLYINSCIYAILDNTWLCKYEKASKASQGPKNIPSLSLDIYSTVAVNMGAESP